MALSKPIGGGLLETRGWLSERPSDFRGALLAGAQPRRFDKGDTLYHYGDPALGLFGVLSGAVAVSIPADNGEEFTAHHDGAGFWIGDLAMLSDQTRLVTVTALRDTETLYIPAGHIIRMVRETPRYYADFYALTHSNMELALRLMANLAVANADHRLELRLLMLDERLDTPGGWLDVNQEDLAAMVAVSLPTLQRKLRVLTEAGMVEQGYGRIRVLDRSRLLSACQA
ncbi:Crp/Fnr family transcriptional regulator [Lutimaribacter marinistellae]|uniref:Crp/Fnr family transcriptional regulator n=1 Tax=Lutimaribacter marinistellae TaxID=1820329 RepID=A0ABV7TNW2_9RHOB